MKAKYANVAAGLTKVGFDGSPAEGGNRHYAAPAGSNPGRVTSKVAQRGVTGQQLNGTNSGGYAGCKEGKY